MRVRLALLGVCAVFTLAMPVTADPLPTGPPDDSSLSSVAILNLAGAPATVPTDQVPTNIQGLDGSPNLYCERVPSETGCNYNAGQQIDPNRYVIRYCASSCSGWGTTNGRITMHLGDANYGNQFTAWCVTIFDGVHNPASNCGAQWKKGTTLDTSFDTGSAGSINGWYSTQADP